MTLTVLEICAGGGGQATALEVAGFNLAAAVEMTIMLATPSARIAHSGR